MSDKRSFEEIFKEEQLYARIQTLENKVKALEDKLLKEPILEELNAKLLQK